MVLEVFGAARLWNFLSSWKGTVLGQPVGDRRLGEL